MEDINENEIAEESGVASDSYCVKVNRFSGPQFDGPLELLVSLVKKARIDIQDFFVFDITEQYIAFMEEMNVFDLEGASEFIEIAALLIEIKSKSLLPRAEEAVEDTDAQQLQQEIMRRMYSEEYEVYKGASVKMKDLETVGTHYREPDMSMLEPKLVLKDMTMDGLIKALQKMLLKLESRAKTPVEREIKRDRFTVDEMVSRIKDTMSLCDKIGFFELFDDDFTKTEIITTFQAMLELMKAQFIRVEQHGTFEEITIHKVA